MSHFDSRSVKNPRSRDGLGPAGHIKIHRVTHLPDPALDTNARLRLATHIHFALLRQFNENVAVSALLEGEADAREALWVCEGSDDAELMSLAQRFRSAASDEAHAATVPTKAGVPQEMAWAQDTSGFGVSRPLELADVALDAQPSWLHPSRWLRRGVQR
jgi:hypothetical protein